MPTLQDEQTTTTSGEIRTPKNRLNQIILFFFIIAAGLAAIVRFSKKTPNNETMGKTHVAAALDPSQAGSGSWDFIDFNLGLKKLDKKTTGELIEMLETVKTKVLRDAILTVLFRRGITIEELANLFAEGWTVTIAIKYNQFYVFVDAMSGAAQEKIFLGAIEGEGAEGNTVIEITTNGGYTFEFTDVPGNLDGGDLFEAQMEFEAKIEGLMKKLGYRKIE